MSVEAKAKLEALQPADEAEVEKPVPTAREVYPKLRTLLKKYQGKSHLLILQGVPDPDAISSAMALDFLGQRFEIETTIMCFSNVSHYENRALVKRLGIKLLRYDENLDLSKFAIYSLVDSQNAVTPIDDQLAASEVTFLAFIDHHREVTVPPPALFVDVREHVGSTAAILCEYLNAAHPKGLEPSDADHVRLATALMHGIRSDTGRFLKATPPDFHAASFLSPCIDSLVIEQIERRVLTSAILGILENALVNRTVIDNFIFSDVGFVRPQDRDGIPLAAELLLDREGTDTVLVFGIVDEKIIDGSFRTRSETINPDEFIKGFLGSSPENGRFYGGGNVTDRGGFQIPLGFLCQYDDREQVRTMARKVIEKAFLEYIGKNSEHVGPSARSGSST